MDCHSHRLPRATGNGRPVLQDHQKEKKVGNIRVVQMKKQAIFQSSGSAISRII